MATDLGCPVWFRGTRGLLVNGDKHVKGSRRRFDSCHPSYVSTLQGNALEEPTPRKGVVYKAVFCSHRPAPTVVPIYA